MRERRVSAKGMLFVCLCGCLVCGCGSSTPSASSPQAPKGDQDRVATTASKPGPNEGLAKTVDTLVKGNSGTEADRGSEGYLELVRAGNAVRGPAHTTDWSSAPVEQLRSFLEANRSVAATAREVLSRQGLTSVEHPSESPMDSLSDAGAVRTVARVLQVEGLLAEREGRIDDAMQSDLDQLRLSLVLQGGQVDQLLVSLAIEQMGLYGLRGLRDQVDADQGGRVVEALVGCDANREPIGKVLAREEKQGPGDLGPLPAGATLSEAEKAKIREALNKVRQPMLDRVERRFELTKARLRLLAADLAVRRYWLEHKQYPDQLADVAPKYVSAVPVDPYSDKPLIYRKGDDTYTLYSIGPDRHDDGGQRVALESLAEGGTGDFFVDTE